MHFVSANSVGISSRVLSMLKAMRSRFLTDVSVTTDDIGVGDLKPFDFALVL